MLKTLTAFALTSLLLCNAVQSRADDLWDWAALSRSPSLLILEDRVAEAGASDLYAGLDLNLGHEHRMMLYLNRSIMADKADGVSNAFGLSVTSATDRLASVTLGVDYLDQQSAIAIDSYHLSLALSPDRWRFSLSAERRQIELVTNPRVRRYRPRIDVSTTSEGITLRVGYYGWEAWGVSLYYRRDRYDKDLEILARRPRWSQLIFTQAGLNAVWNLTKRQQGLSLNRYFERSDLSASYDKSWSAIDDATFFYLTLRFGYQLDDDWRVEIEGGNGFAETEKQRSNSYAALAMIRAW